MQVSLENTANLERRLTVSLPAERLEGVVGTRLREIARTANLKGFRPGRVPTKVIEQRFGSQVRAEAYGELVRESLNEAIRQQNLQPAGNPSIQPDGEGENGEIRFTATFEVVPDFGPIDVAKLEVVRATAQVEDADIDTMIETLRQQRRTWNPVDRPAQNGDAVSMETHATVGPARVPEQGVEQGATVIGSGAMMPEIETRLVGMSAGEEGSIEVAFPADWRVPALAGKTATVTLKVLSVSEPVLPELDESFIKSFGIKSGKVEQFRKEVRANLERELKGNLMSRLRSEVSSKLVMAFAQVELPPRLIENEAQQLARAAEHQARQQGQGEVNLSHESFLVPARNRVAAALLVGEIARQNGLKLEGKRVSETLQLIASTYENPAEVIELYRNDPNLMANLQNRVMEEQVIDWIAERAHATDLAMSFSDVMRPA